MARRVVGDNMRREGQVTQENRWREIALATGRGLTRVAPGLAWMRAYDRAWLRSDLIAGVTVAAVIVPVAMAYGQLAGLPPVTGIYASMLPLVAYALFGSSRSLILGPDAASAALVAAAVIPLAHANADRYVALAALLAILTGALCLVAGMARLGFVASFLSKPILVGYMNGLALTVIVSQLPTVLGIPVNGSGFFTELGQTIAGLGRTHLLTLVIGAGVIAIVWLLRRYAPRAPGPLLAVAAATIAVIVWHLDRNGVSVIGSITPGLPALALPEVTLTDATRLLGDALGIALLTFSDAILNARTFAARQGDHIRPSQELVGLGVANAVAGLSHGFPIGASGTRTAVNLAAGGKTQLTSIVAAVSLAVMLLFLTDPMSRFPKAGLAALLIIAAIQIIDLRTLRTLATGDLRELLIALVTLIGVLTVGLLQGIVLAIVISLFILLARTVRPHDAVLGRVKGVDGFQDVEEFPDGDTVPGLIVYRFDAPLFFANADYFQRRVNTLLAEATNPVAWFLLDAEAITDIDMTAAEMLDTLRRDLASKGIALVIARAKHPLRSRMRRLGLFDKIGAGRFYASIRSAVAAFDARPHA